MSHLQFRRIRCLYLDLHGLVFETSIWLLAGSTRYLMRSEPEQAREWTQASPETVHFAAPEGTRVVETNNREVELASRW